MTVGDAATLYLNHMAKFVGSADTTKWERAALKPLVDSYATVPVLELSYRHLDGFLDILHGKAMATQSSYWLALARACKWWNLKKITGRDLVSTFMKEREKRDDPLPWNTRRGRNAMNAGKTQLRNLSEARRYLEAALSLDTPERRVAATLPLLAGLSSGEVRHLHAGDVDFPARHLWIRGDADAGVPDPDWSPKTAKRAGMMKVPRELLADFEILVSALSPEEYIFRADDRNSESEVGRIRVGKVHHGSWLRDLVRSVCEKAGVRIVSPHGLRGTYATLLRVLARRTDVEIAESMRHGDQGRTVNRHYMGAPEERRVLRLVEQAK